MRLYHLDESAKNIHNLFHAVLKLDQARSETFDTPQARLALTAAALYEQTGFRGREAVESAFGKEGTLFGQRVDNIVFYPPSEKLNWALDRMDKQIDHYATAENFPKLPNHIHRHIFQEYSNVSRRYNKNHPESPLPPRLEDYLASDARTPEGDEVVRKAFRAAHSFRGFIYTRHPELGEAFNNLADDEMVAVMEADAGKPGAPTHVFVTHDFSDRDYSRERMDPDRDPDASLPPGSLLTRLQKAIGTSAENADPEQRSHAIERDDFIAAATQIRNRVATRGHAKWQEAARAITTALGELSADERNVFMPPTPHAFVGLLTGSHEAKRSR